jgi:hypothetical protein
MLRSGRPEKAIGCFRAPFRREVPMDAPLSFAAAHTDWADALVDVGLLADATRTP